MQESGTSTFPSCLYFHFGWAIESGARRLFIAANETVFHLQHLPAIFLHTMSVSGVLVDVGLL